MKKMHDEGYGKKAIMAKYKHMEMATLEKLYASSCGTREEVEESSKAALAKKLAKAAEPSEKGKKAVTLKKAPFDIPKEEKNEEEVIMNPKKDKDKKAETMANETKVNELSNKTLTRYAMSADNDVQKRRSNRPAGKGDESDSKIGKRLSSINLAHKKGAFKKESVDLDEATGKEISSKMMKSKTMKAFASKVAKMPKVTRDDLEKMLPDYVSGADITKLFKENLFYHLCMHVSWKIVQSRRRVQHHLKE
jgi:hypothetical protein